MNRLSAATLHAVPDAVARPAYDPADVAIGVVHFGPGAFHRAHQAAYFDALLAHDPRWGIAAVSLRTRGVVDALAAQDGLYSLTTLDAETSTRIVAAHRAWLGPDDGERVLDLLGRAETRLVTTTVTEKGYCLTGDGRLDFDHADIAHDLGRPAFPRSVIGWIVAGLARRRAAGLPPFAVLCCDNMADNGDTLRAATIAFARRQDDALADWIAAEGAFPNTMVDSITPATDDRHLARTAAILGVEDRAAIQREAFTQWVVADVALPGSPDLGSVGVIRTASVAMYERAKLRMLNGAHSALAYLGIARGHASVADAMADADLARFVEAMVRQDVIPTVGDLPGFDLGGYADAIFARFRNPAIRHLLSQIAWDGSQKLPYRLLHTLADAHDAGRPVDRLLLPIAAWMRFVAEKARTGDTLTDPLAAELVAAAAGAGDADALVDRLLGFAQIFPAELAEDGGIRAGLRSAVRTLEAGAL